MEYDHEWFLRRIQERRPDDYKEFDFLEPYKRSTVRIKAIHIPCGKLVNILPNSFISRKSGCTDCNKSKLTLNQTKTQEEFESELPKGMKALSKYKGAYSKVKVFCTICGETYEATARELTNRECTRCTGRYKRTLADVKKEIREATNGEHIVVSKVYRGTHKNISIRHAVCGEVYEITRSNFRRGQRCHHCNSSRGELLVAEYLDNVGVEYERQKKYEDLKRVNLLSYDFYLPKYNTLIEYQGEQHYKPVEHFGGIKQYELQKEIDDIKRKYAIEKGIRLIEIPYTIANSSDVKKFLNKSLSLAITR